VIINNAGLMPYSPLERCKIDDWDRMIEVNLKGEGEQRGQVSNFANQLTARVRAYLLTWQPTQLTCP
jgi:NADP-dependent 3-hydroxy acid dehydrogenase YdfG